MRRSFDIAELTDEEFAELEAAARMDSRHDHLDDDRDATAHGAAQADGQ